MMMRASDPPMKWRRLVFAVDLDVLWAGESMDMESPVHSARVNCALRTCDNSTVQCL
jgi:hypothetical protein